ncbi:zinc finger MSN2 [Fusarium beomiforme]|uniref:Zinc finger MSN2 n=1 Tax=Fusarium beomiforme TaxID=44412 RepID=A0A9P5E4P0_9HYPO|nr:zinc finger MSN2 [Fusarium beomiforme]
MDGRTPINDPLFMSETLDFNLDFEDNDLDSLSLRPPYHTNDAAFADVCSNDCTDNINVNNTNIFSTHPYLNNPNFLDPPDVPALENTYLDILPIDWHCMMPKVNDPSATTLTGSTTTAEPSNYSSTYTNSSSPMTCSPTGPSQSQVANYLSAKDDEIATSTTTIKRRTKMEPGTRPCDLK